MRDVVLDGLLHGLDGGVLADDVTPRDARGLLRRVLLVVLGAEVLLNGYHRRVDDDAVPGLDLVAPTRDDGTGRGLGRDLDQPAFEHPQHLVHGAEVEAAHDVDDLKALLPDAHRAALFEFPARQRIGRALSLGELLAHRDDHVALADLDHHPHRVPPLLDARERDALVLNHSLQALDLALGLLQRRERGRRHVGGRGPESVIPHGSHNLGSGWELASEVHSRSLSAPKS